MHLISLFCQTYECPMVSDFYGLTLGLNFRNCNVLEIRHPDYGLLICDLCTDQRMKHKESCRIKSESVLSQYAYFLHICQYEVWNIHLPVPGIDGILWRSSEIWVFNPAGSHIFLKNTLKLNYDSLISASKNYFWLLVKIAFLYEVSVSACRVLHSWEQRNDAVHGGDKDIS